MEDAILLHGAHVANGLFEGFRLLVVDELAVLHTPVVRRAVHHGEPAIENAVRIGRARGNGPLVGLRISQLLHHLHQVIGILGLHAGADFGVPARRLTWMMLPMAPRGLGRPMIEPPKMVPLHVFVFRFARLG